MPYVKKINGYNVKDEEARNQIRELQNGKANVSDVERLLQDNVKHSDDIEEAKINISELQTGKANSSDVEQLEKDYENLSQSMEEAENQIKELGKKGVEITRAEYELLQEDVKNVGLYYIKDENLIIYNGVNYGEKQKVECLASNPNLLINGDFRVNQRGQTSYTGGASNAYGVDRWYVLSNKNTMTVSDNGIILHNSNSSVASCAIYQVLEYLPIGTYTLTAKMNGEIYSETFEWQKESISKTFDGGLFIGLSYSNSLDTVYVGQLSAQMTTDLEIEWVKLEPGNVATPFIPRLYAEELQLCKRYFQVVQVRDTVLYGLNTDLMYFTKSFQVEFRANPKCELNSITVMKNGASQTGFTFAINGLNTNLFMISATKNAHGIAITDIPCVNGTIKFDAEFY